MPSNRQPEKKDAIAVALGKTIQKYRSGRTLTQEEAAELAEISDMQWGRIERGENCPSFATLRRMSSVLI